MGSKSIVVLFGVFALFTILAVSPSAFAATASSNNAPSTGSGTSASGSPTGSGTSASGSPTGSGTSASGSSVPPVSSSATTPEFGAVAMLVLLIAVISTVVFTAKTRIPRL